MPHCGNAREDFAMFQRRSTICSLVLELEATGDGLLVKQRGILPVFHRSSEPS